KDHYPAGTGGVAVEMVHHISHEWDKHPAPRGSQAPRTWGWTGQGAPHVRQRRPSPTHVGMDRHRAGARRRPRPEPHARGDGPRLSRRTTDASSRAPRTWGDLKVSRVPGGGTKRPGAGWPWSDHPAPGGDESAVVADHSLESCLRDLHEVVGDALGDTALGGHTGQELLGEETRGSDLAGVEVLVRVRGPVDAVESHLGLAQQQPGKDDITEDHEQAGGVLADLVQLTRVLGGTHGVPDHELDDLLGVLDGLQEQLALLLQPAVARITVRELLHLTG